MRMFAGLLATLLLASGNAYAQPRDVQKADVLFREGRALMKAGKLDFACPKLQESYRLDPGVGVAANVGDCFEKQGKVGSALLAYKAARKLLRPGDPRIVPVEKQVAMLERRVPKLTITLAPDAPEGTRVVRDGKPVDFADFGRALPVNPGNVVIVVSAPGRQDKKQIVTLGEGEPKEIAATVGAFLDRDDPGEGAATPQDQSMAAATPETHGDSQHTAGYIVGGVGLLGLSLGVFFLHEKNSATSSADEISKKIGGGNTACESSQSDDCRKLDEARRSEDRNGAAAAASFIIGGLGVATGVALLLWPGSSGSAASSGFQVSARVGLRGADLHGRF